MKLCHLQQHGWTQTLSNLSEVNQKQKGKYYIISLICGIEMTQTNLSTEQTQRHREQTSGCQRSGEGWDGGLGSADATILVQNV